MQASDVDVLAIGFADAMAPALAQPRHDRLDLGPAEQLDMDPGVGEFPHEAFELALLVLMRQRQPARAARESRARRATAPRPS